MGLTIKTNGQCDVKNDTSLWLYRTTFGGYKFLKLIIARW